MPTERERALTVDDQHFRLLGARVLFAVCVIAGTVLLIRSWTLGHNHAVRAELLALSFSPVIVWLIRSGRAVAASNTILTALYVASLWASISGPGVYGTAILFVMILPLLGGLFGGPRGIWVWSTLSPLATAIVAYGHARGWIADMRGNLAEYSARIPTLITFQVVIITTTTAFLRLHHDALQRLILKIRQLDKENQEHIQAEQAARISAETQGRFLATMSHELRTPLNGVICAARLIEESKTKEEQKELVTTLVDSAEGLLTLINDILDHARLEQGAMQFQSVPFEVRPALQRWTRGLALLASERALRFELSVADSVPAVLVGDPTRIGQLVVNLLGNAVKFTERGTVGVHADYKDNHLVMVVSDTGIGILPENIGNLFQPFSQLESSTTRRFGGSGLGLTIVRQLTEGMGGTIGVASTPGRGSEFTLRLPCDIGERQQESTEEKTFHPKNLRILVVDDNPVNRKVQGLLLESWGHHVRTEESGANAASLALSQQWDLILMDCQMPEVDGFEATRRIRLREPANHRVLVVGLSADVRPEAREESLRSGMDEFITKPIRRPDFDQIVNRFRDRLALQEGPPASPN